MESVVVVGAGQAGASLCAKLRNEGFDGRITLLGAEPVPPYQRPPLSKSYLLGEMGLERLFLRPEQFYADEKIDLRMHAPVTKIDRVEKTVTVGTERLQYDKLALTTGSEPRHLPSAIGGGLHGVHVVRSLHDVDLMAPQVRNGARALIIGGGYIGLEAAAVAAKMGLDVTLIEMADRILQRVAARETSDYFRALHHKNGVKILENTGLVNLLGERHVTGAELSTGTILDVDLAIVGIGISPNVDLGKRAGLHIDNGIAVNETCQTSDPDIYAAGDCASFERDGARIRLESVQNAIDQAEAAALNMLGRTTPYVPKPWFWSDQYDVKLQIAGLNTGYDTIVTRQGDTNGVVSYWYYRDGNLLAVDAMNDPRAYMVGKRLIDAGKSVDPKAVSDPETDLKLLLRA